MTCIAYSQPKSPEVWAALREGFDAVEADPTWTKGKQRALRRDGPVILGGLGFDQPALLKEARDTGHPYVFVDSGYFATHENGKRVRYRVVPGAYAHHWTLPADFRTLRLGRERFEALRIKIERWRKAGREVLVCLSSDAHAQFFGLQSWLDDTLEQLRRGTDRPIVIRKKDDPVPFAEQLKTAWAVVTWSSNVAVTAALAGVPVFVGPECAALPVGTSLGAGGARYIEEPVYPDREAWAWGLAVGQFTVAEMASGFAGMVADNWHLAGNRKEIAA